MSRQPSKPNAATRLKTTRGGKAQRGTDRVAPKCFLLDENIPDGVREVLTGAGQHVQLVRDVLGCETPDELVAKYANDVDACVVTHNVKHFKKLVGRQSADFPRASGLFMECREWEDAPRIASALPHVLVELDTPEADGRVFITIMRDRVVIHR